MRKLAIRTAVDATADVLRHEIMQREDGELLGAEDELANRIGVSRPTLRQAARLLEAEELLTVRRGLNGGMFARRPTTDAVARMASVYLRSERPLVLDLARTWFLLLEHSAALAAQNPDPVARHELLVDFEQHCHQVPPHDRRSAFEVLQQFCLRIADISGSPTTQLFIHVLHALIALAPEDLRPVDRPNDFKKEAADLGRAARAIDAGDAAAAARHIRRHGAQLMTWLEAQMPERRL